MPDESPNQRQPAPAGFARGLLALLFIGLGIFLIFKFMFPAFFNSTAGSGSTGEGILDSATSVLGKLKSTFWEEDSGKAQGNSPSPLPSASPADQTSQGNSAPTGASGTSPGKNPPGTESTPGEKPIVPPWKSDSPESIPPASSSSKKKYLVFGGGALLVLLIALFLWLRRKRAMNGESSYLRTLGYLSGRVLYDSGDDALSQLSGRELYEREDLNAPSPPDDLVVGVMARVEGELKEIVSEHIGESGKFFLRVPHFKLEPLGDLSKVDADLGTTFSREKGVLVFAKNSSGGYFFHCVPLKRSKLGRGGFGHIDESNPPAKKLDKTSVISGKPIVLSRLHREERNIIIPIPEEETKPEEAPLSSDSDGVPQADTSGGSPASSNEEYPPEFDFSQFVQVLKDSEDFCKQSISYFESLKESIEKLKEDNPLLTIPDNDNALFYKEKNKEELKNLVETHLKKVSTDLLRWLAHSSRFASILSNPDRGECGKIKTLISVGYKNPRWWEELKSFKESFNEKFLNLKEKERVIFKILIPPCPPDQDLLNKLKKEENKDNAEILTLEFLPLILRVGQLNALLEPYLEISSKNLKIAYYAAENLKSRTEKTGPSMRGEEVNQLKHKFKKSLKILIEAVKRTELIVNEFSRIDESSKFEEVKKKLEKAARTEAREEGRQKSIRGKGRKEASLTIGRGEQKPAEPPEREGEQGNTQPEPAKVTGGNLPGEDIKLGIDVPNELKGRYPENFPDWKFEQALDFFYRTLKRAGFHYNPEQNEIRIPSIEGDTNLKSFYTFLVNKGELQASLPEQKIKRVLKKNNLDADVKKENDFIFIYNKHTEKKTEPGELRLYLACKPEARDPLTVAFVKNFSKIPNLRSFKFYKRNEKRNDNMVLYFYTGTPAGEVDEVLKIIAGVASEFYNKGDSAFEEYLIPPLCSCSLIFRNTVIGELTYWPLKSSEEDYGISVEIPEEWRDETTPSRYILSVETPNDFKAKMITILDLLTRIFEKNESLPDVPSAGHVIKTVSKVLLRSNTRGKELEKGLDGLCGELSRGILTYLR